MLQEKIDETLIRKAPEGMPLESLMRTLGVNGEMILRRLRSLSKENSGIREVIPKYEQEHEDFRETLTLYRAMTGMERLGFNKKIKEDGGVLLIDIGKRGKVYVEQVIGEHVMAALRVVYDEHAQAKACFNRL